MGNLVEKNQVKLGQKIKVGLVVNVITPTDSLSVTVKLPLGLDYDPKSSRLAEYNATTRELIWRNVDASAVTTDNKKNKKSARYDDYSLKVTATEAPSELVLSTAVEGGNGECCLALPTLLQVGSQKPDADVDDKAGGKLKLDDRIEVAFAAGAVKQKTKVNGITYKVKPATKDAPMSLAVPFELFPEMVFDAPVTVTIDLNGLGVDDDALDNGWMPTLVYLKPEIVTQTANTDTGTLVFTYTTTVEERVFSQFDRATGKLTAAITHFSSYQVSFSQPKPEPWKLSANGGNVGLFRGAVSYAYPIAVPGMVDGLQPNLALQYSSAAADGGANGSSPGVGLIVGKGWDLDVPRITRVVKREWALKPWGHPIGPDAGQIWSKCDWNNSGADGACVRYLRTRYVNDFSLSMGGQTYRLVPKFDVNAQTGGEYITESFSPLRIVRCNTQFTCANVNNQNLTVPGAGNATEYWQVWTPDGTRWVFGIDTMSTNAVTQANDKDDTQYNIANAMGTPDSSWIASYNPTNAFNNARAMYAGEVSGQITRIWFLRRVYAANRDDVNTAGRWSVEWQYTDQGYNGGADEIKRCLANNSNSCSLATDPLVRVTSVTYGPSIKPDNTAATQRYRVVFNYAWGTRLDSLETQVVNASGTPLKYVRKVVVDVQPGCVTNGDEGLFSINEQVWNGSTWVGGLPATTFIYADKPHDNGQRCLLQKITNGYGGEWEYTYQGNSTWNSYWVTQKIVRSGMVGSLPMTTTYAYSKPADNADSNYADWCIQLSGKGCINSAHVFWGDWPNNLSGFKTATETALSTSGAALVQSVHTFVHDDYKRVGLELSARNWGYDQVPTWKVLQAQSSTYTDLAYYGSNSYTSGKVWHYKPTASVQYVLGDVGSSPSTQTDVHYDGYGNVTRRIEYGLNTNSGDERTTVLGYYPNTLAWIVNKPAYENVYANATTGGSVLNDFQTQSILTYDSNANFNVAPTKGQLKRVVSGATQATSNLSILLITQTIGYDAVGNLSSITDPRGYVSTATYDSDGWFLKQVQNAAGHTVKYAYYGVNEGDCTLSGGNGLYGAAKCSIDPNLQPTGYTYDGFGRLTGVVRPGDSWSVPTVGYEYGDNISSGGLRGLRVIEWQLEVQGNASYKQPRVSYFDGLGRLQQSRVEQTNGMAMTVVSTAYNELSQPYQQSAPVIATATSYGDATTFWGYQAPDWSKPNTTTSYDGLGRVTKVTAPDGTATKHYYASDTDVNAWCMGYSTTGNMVHSVVDANNHSRHQITNGLGQMVRVREFTGTVYSCSDADRWQPIGETTYVYDALNQLKSVTDAANNITSMNYDALGRKIGMNDPDMGVWSYSYDANGNLTSQTDAKGQTISFSYDALNRMRTKVYPNGDSFYHMYDEAGQANAIGRRTYTQAYYSIFASDWTRWYYDTRGRVTTEQRNIDNVTYGTGYNYDAADRVTSMSYPDGETVATTYDNSGKPLSLQSSWGTTAANSTWLVSTASYNQLGAPKTIVLGNGSTQQYLYHGIDTTGIDGAGAFLLSPSNANWGRLWQTRVINTANSRPYEFIQEMQYDSVGNVAKQATHTYARWWEAMQYSYDPLDRLKSVSPYGIYPGESSNYNFNAIGNMTTKDVLGTLNYNAHVDNNPNLRLIPHAVSDIAGPSGTGLVATYDANGNMTRRWNKGVWFGQEWNPDNKLTRTYNEINTAHDVRYFYDADGARVKTTTSQPVQPATDSFNSLDTNRWQFGVPPATFGIVNQGGNNVIRVIGDGTVGWLHENAWWTGNFQFADSHYGAANDPQNIVDGQTVSIDFKLSDLQSGATLGIEGWDSYGYYRRLGVFNWSNGLRVQTCAGASCTDWAASPQVLYNTMQANVWYRVTWVLNGNNGVQVQVKERDTGANPVSYVYTGLPGGLRWRFHFWVNSQSPTYLDNYDQRGTTIVYAGNYEKNITTGEITKYFDFGGQRVAMRKYTGTPTSTSVTWLHSDHLGSASLATDYNGNALPGSDQRYTPFGSPRITGSVLPSKYTFTGQRSFMDEIGTMDYGARQYSPLLGRFLSADTVVPGAGNPQALNRYSYVFNNPLKYIDPSGYDPLDAKWKKEYCAKNSCKNGEPSWVAKQDRLFEVMFVGSNPDGSWTEDDRDWYNANRQALWDGKIPWRNNDSITDSGTQSFATHLETLSSQYTEGERAAFVDAIALFWAGLPAGGHVVGAILSLRYRQNTGRNLYDLQGFNEDADDMPFGLRDSQDSDRDQAHHYAGFVLAGYYLPAGRAKRGVTALDDPKLNRGDVNLGNLAVDHGRILANSSMSIPQWVRMVRLALTSK